MPAIRMIVRVVEHKPRENGSESGRRSQCRKRKFTERSLRVRARSERSSREAIQPSSFGVVARTSTLTALDLKSSQEMKMTALQYQVAFSDQGNKPHSTVTNNGYDPLCDMGRQGLKMRPPVRIRFYAVAERGRKDHRFRAVHGPNKREIYDDALLRDSGVKCVGDYDQLPVRDLAPG